MMRPEIPKQLTRRNRFWRWIVLAASIPLAIYFVGSMVFYSWLSAAQSERWPVEKASLWAGGAAALSAVSLSALVYCTVTLIRDTNRRYRASLRGDTHAT